MNRFYSIFGTAALIVTSVPLIQAEPLSDPNAAAGIQGSFQTIRADAAKRWNSPIISR